jgi:hypothetical protein
MNQEDAGAFITPRETSRLGGVAAASSGAFAGFRQRSTGFAFK